MNSKPQISRSPLIAYTSRLTNFLEDPNNERGVLPMACTLYKPSMEASNNEVKMVTDTCEYLILALVTAAGINVHLDNFQFGKALSKPNKKISFYLREDHPDWSKIEKEMERGNNTACLFNNNKPSETNVTNKPKTFTITIQDSIQYDESEPGNISIVEALDIIAGFLTVVNTPDHLCVDLSNLRQSGIKTKRAESTGPLSFAEIYDALYLHLQKNTVSSLLTLFSTINGNVRKGGRYYKNGIVTTSIPCYHKDALEYIEADPALIHPWIAKGLVITSDWYEYYPNQTIKAVNEGSLWLEKCLYGDKKELLSSQDSRTAFRLLTNVCREILMESQGTCMLLPYNLGQCKIPLDVIHAVPMAMELICKLHAQNYQSSLGIYLGADKDKQVGVEPIGLANLLARENISYRDFAYTLEHWLKIFESILESSVEVKTLGDLYAFSPEYFTLDDTGSVDNWVLALIKAYAMAENVARSYGMYRAFCVAPTASVSYRNEDTDGFTTAPEISPPLYAQVERVTATEEKLENDIYSYPPNVEIASIVGFDIYTKLTSNWQKLQDLTGLGHSISYNVWEDVDFNWINNKYLNSNIVNTYYRLNVDYKFMDKSDQLGSCSLTQGCTSCDEA